MSYWRAVTEYKALGLCEPHDNRQKSPISESELEGQTLIVKCDKPFALGGLVLRELAQHLTEEEI